MKLHTKILGLSILSLAFVATRRLEAEEEALVEEGALNEDALAKGPEGEFPKLPRTEIALGTLHGVEVYSKSALTLLKIISTEVGGGFALTWDSSLYIVKHNPENLSLLKYKTGSEGLKFESNDKNPIFAYCTYTQGAKFSVGLAASLGFSLLTPSATLESGLAQIFNAKRFSSLHKITGEDTLESLENLCRVQYRNQVKKKVEAELFKLIATEVVPGQNAIGNRALAINAAVYGPRVKRILVEKNHFDIDPVQVSRLESGKLEVRGSLRQNIRGGSGDRFEYRCEGDAREMKVLDYGYQEKLNLKFVAGNFRKVAQSLIRDICESASFENPEH